MKILAFGIVKDMISGTSVELQLGTHVSVGSLKKLLEEQYPGLKSLASYMVAVNDEYAVDDVIIKEDDEVAIIPPVSGG